MTAELADEDSGLHDIRELARSSKARISQKRITDNPPIDDDVLASSSGAWKAVALPEPAKMVSLPDVASLPSAKEIKKAEKAAAKQAAVAATAAAPAKAAAPAPARPRATTSRRAPWVAIAGVAVAAAAGVTIYVVTQSSNKDAAPTRVASETTVAPAPVVRPAAPVVVAPAPAPAPAEPAAQPQPDPQQVAAAEPPPAAEAPATGEPKHAAQHKPTAGKAPAKASVATSEDTTTPPPPPAKTEAKPEPAKAVGKKKGNGDDEPSFDDLLKEAGVDQTKAKPKKPTLDKKELSGDDFKHGMAAVASRAQACYKGTQGTAQLRLTVAPSGKITKVAVSGQFSGKPEADCVANAVKGATFPAWDGPAQSFGYSYLLSE